MSNIELDENDISTLLDALKSWEKEPVISGIANNMYEMVLKSLVRDDEKSREEQMEESRREMRESRNKQEAEMALRHDASIFLQAKLIMLRSQLLASK